MSQTKKVKTVAGDSVLVVDGPKDGNCLIAAFVRGLVSGGRPLSPHLEQQAMDELRGILSKVIIEHTWPHPDVASPQTITQCAEETARNCGWCGEVAMAAFASITGTCLKLYRYVNDEKKGNIIEPLMNWNINEGDGDDRRPVIHLLQTRLPLPGQPEHCSHWEILMMVPPEPALVGIEYGPIIVDNKDSNIECYEYILNRDVYPHFEVKQWCKYKIKGRGRKHSMERVVCQIQRKITTKRNQSTSYGPIQIKMLSNDGALSIVTKSINEIESPTTIPISDTDLKEIKLLWTKATTPQPVIVAPEGPAGAPRKRKRTTSTSALGASNENSSTISNQNSPAKAKPKTKRHATPKKAAQQKVASKSRSKFKSNLISSSSSSSSSGSESDVSGHSPAKQTASAAKKTQQPKRQFASRPARPDHEPPKTKLSPPPSTTTAPPENNSFSQSSIETRMSQLESNVNRLIQLTTSVVNVPLQIGGGGVGNIQTVVPSIAPAVPSITRNTPPVVYGNNNGAGVQPGLSCIAFNHNQY